MTQKQLYSATSDSPGSQELERSLLTLLELGAAQPVTKELKDLGAAMLRKGRSMTGWLGRLIRSSKRGK